MIREYLAAVADLAGQQDDVPIFAGDVPTDAPRIYARVTVTFPHGVNHRLSASTEADRVLVSVMYVGKSFNEIAWAAEKVRPLLERARPVIEGRRCSPLSAVAEATPHTDDDTLPETWIATDVWRFASHPRRNI